MRTTTSQKKEAAKNVAATEGKATTNPLQLQQSSNNPLQRQAVIQFTTLTEVFDNLINDIDLLAVFDPWLKARAGNDQAERDYLLSRMSVDQVIETLKVFKTRKEKEDAQNSVSLQELIETSKDLNPAKNVENTVDTHLLSSRHIGKIIAFKKSKGVSITGQIVCLDDNLFTEIHWLDWLHTNKHLNLTDIQKTLSKLRLNSGIDVVDGFQSDMDGKIYLRSTKIEIPIAIHESIHKFGGNAFAQTFGHLLNEGTTEYISLLVCAEVGLKSSIDYYRGEKKLLKDFCSVLKVNDKELLDAYFNDNVAGIELRLRKKIGDFHTSDFINAKTTNEAATIFNAGVQRLL